MTEIHHGMYCLFHAKQFSKLLSDLFQGTSIASVRTKHDRRVYFQDKSFNIVEYIYKDGKWSGPQIITSAAKGSGIAAISWNYLGNMYTVRFLKHVRRVTVMAIY